jgi:AraC-like DNA-binding protein
MSPTSFHRHFRAATAMSPLQYQNPLQYQKQIRLQEARSRLMTSFRRLIFVCSIHDMIS